MCFNPLDENIIHKIYQELYNKSLVETKMTHMISLWKSVAKKREPKDGSGFYVEIASTILFQNILYLSSS